MIEKQDKARIFKHMEMLLKRVLGDRVRYSAFDIKKPEQIGYNFYCGFIRGEIYFAGDSEDNEDISSYRVVFKGASPENEEICVGGDSAILELRDALQRFLVVMVKETARIVDAIENTYG